LINSKSLGFFKKAMVEVVIRDRSCIDATDTLLGISATNKSELPSKDTGDSTPPDIDPTVAWNNISGQKP
jgi:hypothetical protein